MHTISTPAGISRTISYEIVTPDHIRQTGTKAKLRTFTARSAAGVVTVEARNAWDVLDIERDAKLTTTTGWSIA